ncbi:hypothetical protein J7K19_08450 [bacterium]|nr:hypothetical protein [bacterium]
MKHINILTKAGLMKPGKNSNRDVYSYCDETSTDNCIASDQGSCFFFSDDYCGYDQGGCADSSGDYCGGYDYGSCFGEADDYCQANDYTYCYGHPDYCSGNQGGNDYCDSPPAPDFEG